jgi:16S rRNA (guanine1207-N2)-methyltransferase
MGQYFTNNPQLKTQQKIHHVIVNQQSFHFATDHGVFSKKGLDFGSRLLIDTVLNTDYQKVLDLGCGYGPIGIIIKYFHPYSDVEMIDINKRALALAKENAKRNHVETTIYESHGFDQVNGMFDMIVTNPPIRAGKDVYYKFFKDALNHLNDNGALFVVIQKKQGAASAMQYCRTLYRDVEVVQKKSGYLVFKCMK